MSEQTKILLYIKNMLADLMYLNGVIATELIEVTENTATLRHGEKFLDKTSCLAEHNQLNQKNSLFVPGREKKFYFLV